jgi:hypothetical protein
VRHIDIIHHFARGHAASGELAAVHCNSETNVIDGMTKVLPRLLLDKGLGKARHEVECDAGLEANDK